MSKYSGSSSVFEGSGDYNTFNLDEQITQNYIKPLKILNLCANLSSHTNSIQIQILLNKFLQQITNSPYVFIIPILCSSEEGIVQVIGDKVLDKEIRFPITTDNIRNASAKGFQFRISGINCSFRDMVESFIGTKHNFLYFDIKELNKNARSTLPAMEALTVLSAESSATGLTNCSTLLNDDLKAASNSDNSMQISFFVGIAGDESCRIYYRYCIYETLRFTIGHLLTAIELNEAKRLRLQRGKLFPILISLLGKLDGGLKPNREAPGFRTFSIKADILKSNVIINKYVYESNEFEKLLNGILKEAAEFVDAQRCFLFLRDKCTRELVSNNQNNNEMQIHPCIGVAGHVAETGKICNMYNTNSSPLYIKSIDEQPGVKTRNILYFPIFDKTDVIGVVQLFNKQNGYHFDKCDEESAKAFSAYTSISIVQSILQRQIRKNNALILVARDILRFHMKISEHEIKELLVVLKTLKDEKIPNLRSFTFLTRDLNLTDTFKASLQMFLGLDFIKKFNIRREKLVQFILIINRQYRNLPYHNWMHAFTSAHFAYALLKNCKLVQKGILNELEALAFLISAFCHDLDHRGTSSSYQTLIKSNIGLLYGSLGSVMERHHLRYTINILLDKHVTIFDNFSKDQMDEVFEAITNFILATDTAHHFNIKQLEHLHSDNCHEYKFLTMTILMTCCNLSDQIKEWPNAEQVTELICQEFFAQGDLERQMGVVPLEIYDRQRAVIPRLQYEFLLNVVLPAYNVLKNILPETEDLIGIVKDNIEHWESQLVTDADQ